jgi:type III restriction enzyme
LKERIELELNQQNSADYADFLNESLFNLKDCSAGYFAQDNSDSDEEVAKEVDVILRNKKELLSFKTADGKWNIRRFLFSKWTLKEGWDNPNVFTITKLRSSGSEISKIQEVGRGLRLPVDEFGNRISNEEFMLNYIVDFKEADFADKLVAEINGDAASSITVLAITDADLERVATLRTTDATTLFIELLQKGYVDISKNIVTNKITAFYDEYPEFNTGVNKTKIVDRNKKKTNMVKIRSERYDELKELWKKLNQKYILFFEKQLNEKIENEFHLENGAFTKVIVESRRERLGTTNEGAYILSDSGVQLEMCGKTSPYNEFLKRTSRATSLPIKLVHKKVKEYFKGDIHYIDTMINESSMTNFISQFNEWKMENIKGLLNYKQANYNSVETALTDVDGKLKPEIAQGLIGISLEKGNPSVKYLYEGIAFDSDLEMKNIKTDIDDVVVFGKIPRRSIAIPTIINNYSPDFMYVVKKKDGTKELNVVIETKGVDNKSELRGEEKMRIACAERFFEQLKIDGYEVKFETQINKKTIKEIVKELVND